MSLIPAKKRLSFPKYVLEGNVIFLSPLSRLSDKELCDLYNKRTVDYFIEVDYDEISGRERNPHLSPKAQELMKSLSDVWSEIQRRKISFEIRDRNFLVYMGKE